MTERERDVWDALRIDLRALGYTDAEISKRFALLRRPGPVGELRSIRLVEQIRDDIMEELRQFDIPGEASWGIEGILRWRLLAPAAPQEQEGEALRHVSDIDPDAPTAFDVCVRCGHYLGEHGSSGCTVIVCRTGPVHECPCSGFAPTVSAAEPHGSEWKIPTAPPADDCPYRRAEFVFNDERGEWEMVRWLDAEPAAPEQGKPKYDDAMSRRTWLHGEQDVEGPLNNMLLRLSALDGRALLDGDVEGTGFAYVVTVNTAVVVLRRVLAALRGRSTKEEG